MTTADAPNGFAALGARPETVEALAKIGITAPFAIQTMTLPIALSGHDLIGQARTGTGKTLGFGVPMLNTVKSKAEGANGTPQALRAFRSGKIDVLVATDVAARGIDVQDVTHVINYQCPDEERTFLHRIGRTGRAGANGVAVT
ncbi:MAG: DEAD/DEAH box helicase, partial [Actinobacteria bacterium]|nr:DEAD/DEAH box helicase [Actinomycetota bacterium]